MHVQETHALAFLFLQRMSGVRFTMDITPLDVNKLRCVCLLCKSVTNVCLGTW